MLLLEMRVVGHPYKVVLHLPKMLAARLVVNSAAVTANMSARQLKRSVKRRM